MDPFTRWRRELHERDLDVKSSARCWQCAQAYRAWLEGRAPDAETARSFLAHLRDLGYRPASIALYYHALHLFLDSLGVKLKVKLRRASSLPPYYDRGDIERLIAQAERGLPGQDKETRRRNYNAVVMLADSGLRRGELLALRVGDADFNNRVVRVRRGKGQKDRAVPLPARAVLALRERARGKGAQQRLFELNARNIYRAIRKPSKAVGLEGFHPHSFRHAYATRLCELGVRLEVVQQLLGHADPATTAVYVQLIPQHLREAVERLEGWDPSPVQGRAHQV